MYIEELTLLASGLPAQEAFYAGTLGLPVAARTPDSVTLRAGASLLTFRRAAGGAACAPYHFAFNVPVDRFDEAVAWLRGRVPLLAGPDGRDRFTFDSWDATAVYFADPAGNVAEFIGRRELAGSAAAAASATLPVPGIQCVSEIGVATEDTDAARAAVEAAAPGVGAYRGDAGPAFTALGDAEGLFIVVPTGRPWFPTVDRGAESLPAVVRIRQGNRRAALTFGPPQPPTPPTLLPVQ